MENLLEPKVTAVITTFNRGHFLPSAIESVLAQTFSDFELLILDNSSVDNTAEIVSGYSDPRIRYILHEEIGISQQRNLAVSLSNGEYIGFLDDDDEWLPNKLTDQLKIFDDNGDELCLVYGKYSFFNESGIYANFSSKMTGMVLSDLLAETDGFCGSASNPLIRKASILSVGGYPEDIFSGEDYYLYLKLSQKYLVANTSSFVVKIRQHDGPRLIGRLDSRLELEERIYFEFNEYLIDSTRRRLLKKIGGKYIRLGSGKRGREVISLALQHNIFDIEAIGQWAASFLSKKLYTILHITINNLKKKKFNIKERFSGASR